MPGHKRWLVAHAIVSIQKRAFMEARELCATTRIAPPPACPFVSIYETSSMLKMCRLLPLASRVPPIFTCLPSYCFAFSWSSS